MKPTHPNSPAAPAIFLNPSPTATQPMAVSATAGKTLLLVAAIFCAALGSVRAQTNFLYDQQSATESGISEGEATSAYQPLGQSFTPTLETVGFVRLRLSTNRGSGSGSRDVQVKLWSGSLGGSLLGVSTAVAVPDAFYGFQDFLFAEPVAVTPGTTYYFQPIAATSGFGINMAHEYAYPGGNAFVLGVERVWMDLWFREGIIVPEPGTGAVLGLGLALLAWVRRPRAS